MKTTRSVNRAAPFFLFLMALLVVMGTPVTADRLELRNGDVITGTILVMDADKVIVLTEYGTLEVSREAVLRGEFGLDEGEVVDSLLLHLDLNATTDDSAGFSHATNNGMRFVADRNGSPAAAARSDGNGTFLTVAPTGELNRLDQFTFSCWVNLEDLSSIAYIFSKWNITNGESADGKVTLQTGGGNLTAYFVDPSGDYHWVTARSVITESVWHALAVTFSGGRANLYVDGVLVASDRFDFTGLYEDSAPILIMTALAQTDDPYTFYNAVGTIDDVRLYSRALSPDEVVLLASDSEAE